MNVRSIGLLLAIGLLGCGSIIPAPSQAEIEKSCKYFEGMLKSDIPISIRKGVEISIPKNNAAAMREGWVYNDTYQAIFCRPVGQHWVYKSVEIKENTTIIEIKEGSMSINALNTFVISEKVPVFLRKASYNLTKTNVDFDREYLRLFR